MERFWSKVDRRDENSCWEWTRGKVKEGYGRFKLNGKQVSAHRLAYSLTYGEAPSGLYVCHRCDNRSCCNPSHLFLGTNQDNQLDCVAKGRSAVHRLISIDRRGINNGRAKLTEDQVCGIMARYLMGISQRQISREYNISSGRVSDIVNLKKWSHLFSGEGR